MRKFSEIWRGTETERDALYYGLNDEEREARETKLYQDSLAVYVNNVYKSADDSVELACWGVLAIFSIPVVFLVYLGLKTHLWWIVDKLNFFFN